MPVRGRDEERSFARAQDEQGNGRPPTRHPELAKDLSRGLSYATCRLRSSPGSSAASRTSARVPTWISSRSLRTTSGNWGGCLGWGGGGRKVRTPPGWAAKVFSRRPPMGRTLPRRVTSPVIATSLRTLRPVRAEMRAVAMVMPAEGPSFGMAPAGVWTWMLRRLEDGGSVRGVLGGPGGWKVGGPVGWFVAPRRGAALLGWA